MSNRVCLITQSWVEDDPRVRKHGDTLHAAGFQVSAIGFSGGRAAPPRWPVVEIDAGPRRRLIRRARKIGPLLGTRRGGQSAVQAWWRLPDSSRWWERSREVQADLYIAHDWTTLPLAARLAEAHQARFAYDSREYGVAEFTFRRTWNMVYPTFIHGSRRHSSRQRLLSTPYAKA